MGNACFHYNSLTDFSEIWNNVSCCQMPKTDGAFFLNFDLLIGLPGSLIHILWATRYIPGIRMSIVVVLPSCSPNRITARPWVSDYISMYGHVSRYFNIGQVCEFEHHNNPYTLTCILIAHLKSGKIYKFSQSVSQSRSLLGNRWADFAKIW